MTCLSPIRELVTLSLARALSEDDAALVREHIATCTECRELADEGATLVAGFRSLHLTGDEIASVAAFETDSPHLSVCSSCRDEVALLRRVNADLGTGSSGRPKPHSWRTGLAAAAILVVSVTAFWRIAYPTGISSVTETPEVSPTVLRGGTGTEITHLQIIRGTEGRLSFTWTPVAGANRYRVGFFSEDGTSIWSRDAATPPLAWPVDSGDDPTRLPGLNRWRVEAFSGDAVVARSRLVDVEVPQ